MGFEEFSVENFSFELKYFMGTFGCYVMQQCIHSLPSKVVPKILVAKKSSFMNSFKMGVNVKVFYLEISHMIVKSKFSRLTNLMKQSRNIAEHFSCSKFPLIFI